MAKLNPIESANLTPVQKAMANQLGDLFNTKEEEKPDSTAPVANPNAKNSNQAADKKVEEQANALARVNEIRNLWATSSEAQRKGLLQAQREWEEKPMHTGEGPLGGYGASSGFESREPIQQQQAGSRVAGGRGGFPGFMIPGILDENIYKGLAQKAQYGAAGQFYNSSNRRSIDEEIMLKKHEQKTKEIQAQKEKELSSLGAGAVTPGVWNPAYATTGLW
jgi:hypothetical protein